MCSKSERSRVCVLAALRSPSIRVSTVDAPAAKAYPISSFTWLLFPAEFSDKSKLKAMKDFLQWMSTDGQKLTEQLMREEISLKKQTEAAPWYPRKTCGLGSPNSK
jgi:hypothetical protein